MVEQKTHLKTVIASIYQQQSRRVFATLIRLLGDFDLAEEALHDAFMAALAQWPEDGIPDNPRAWLISTGRFKAIDQLRRRALFNESLLVLAQDLDEGEAHDDFSTEAINDDALKLIFICCHPSLAKPAQIALTLREVCGLTTEEIARAFLVSPTTIAQRIVRAKNKIRDAGIPYQIPSATELPERVEGVLHVLYLLFNEGYSASAGDAVIRRNFMQEAIRLGRLMVELLPAAEVMGLLGLMLVHDARHLARTNAQGELLTLEQQDRRLWVGEQIAEASLFIQRALVLPECGVYSLQAAIAALHAEAPSYAATDWSQIIALYDILLRIAPSAVVALNRAVAVSMRDGAAEGLRLVLEINHSGELQDYYLWHAACADFYRQLEQYDDAQKAYESALALTQSVPEQRFLEEKVAAMVAGKK